MHTCSLAASGKYEEPIVTELKPAAIFWAAEVSLAWLEKGFMMT